MSLDKQVVEWLRKSREQFGETYPIIVDYDGEVLSGRHRRAAGWRREHRIDTRELAKAWGVSPKMAKLMVRMHLNVQRQPSKEETKALLLEMAQELEKQGVKPEDVASELAKIVPYTHQYVLQLLPDKYKHVEKRRVRKEEKPPEEKPKVIKVEKTWEERLAEMRKPVSKMEEAVAQELQQRGIRFLTQQEFCIQSTIPDFYFPDQNVAVYLDGEEVHLGREERDYALRDLLAKRYGLRVVSIPYQRFSKKEKDRVVRQVLEALGYDVG